MGGKRKIRLGDCPSCGGLILVDVAGDDETPVTDSCPRCGVELDGGVDRATDD